VILSSLNIRNKGFINIITKPMSKSSRNNYCI